MVKISWLKSCSGGWKSDVSVDSRCKEIAGQISDSDFGEVTHETNFSLTIIVRQTEDIFAGQDNPKFCLQFVTAIS